MKKILFNDKFGLTEAVLSGRKTQTRRIITCPKEFRGKYVAGFHVYKRQSDGAMLEWPSLYDADEATIDGGYILPKYTVGEVVAVAQSYKDVGYNHDHVFYRSIPSVGGYRKELASDQKGWNNKMFVCADLMPHHIRITDVRVERLQDISDEDCIKEGIYELPEEECFIPHTEYSFAGNPGVTFGFAKGAYENLIDRISGKGTWDSNPYVFVYDFELVK